MRRMTKPRPSRGRGGFTLIELLTVVAILALLAAIATAAFLRVRGSSEVGATEATLQKLKSGMDKRWKAVIDDAAEDSTKGRIPPAVLTFAGNDKDRARVIWTYCKLKNEFPTTIAEACNPVFVPDATSGTPIQVLTPKAVFVEGYRKQVQSLPPAGATGFTNSTPTTDPNYATRVVTESAACFHWALTATATRGETFEADGTSQQTGEAGVQIPVSYSVGGTAGSGTIPSLRVFHDSWGNPIAFIRQTYLTGEVDKAPYTKATGNLKDPIDPQGRLVTLGGAWDANRLNLFWRTLYPTASRHWNYNGSFPPAAAVLDYPGVPNANPAAASAQSWLPTLVSAGSSKKFWFDPEEATNFGAGDDLFSFRLTRDGKGN